MTGPVLIKGQIRVTLPLKTSASARKSASTSPKEQQRKLQAIQSWEDLNTDAASHVTLALKKRVHQFHRHQAQRRALSSTSIRVHSPPVDPFSSWPIEPTPFVPRMAQYFVQVWAPEHGCAFPVQGHPNPYLSLLWPFALQDDMYFEALVSLCLATWLPTQGIQSRTDRQFLYHRTNVVNKLNERLQHPGRCSDYATILTAATLGTIDYVCGEHSAGPSHVQGMRQIVSMRGGVQGSNPLEKLIQINIAAYESLWSFVTEAKSPIEEAPSPQSLLQQGQLPTYLSHPFKPEVCAMLSRLPQGFCDVGLQGSFSLQMMQILSALNDMSSIPPSPVHSNSNGPVTPDSTSSPPSSSSSSAIDPPQLRSILADLQRLATLQTSPTEHLLCSGLIAYCYTLHPRPFNQSFLAFYSPSIGLLQRCVRHSPETEDIESGCYLWSSVVMGTALMFINTAIERDSEERFVVWEHLIERHEECRRWEELEELMRMFFWGEALEGMVRGCWEEVMARRREKERPSRMRIRDVIL